MAVTRVGLTAIVLLAAVCAVWCAPPAADEAASAQIDEYVSQTPPEATASIESLAGYLVKNASNELQKARAIYAWIVKNIDYDVEGFTSGNPGDQSAQAVLARRKAVCDGYSRLFEALARAAGLEAVQVVGYSRGAGYKAGQPVGPEADHAWTAVRIDGNWFLIDTTWAAGYLDAKAGFVRRQEDYYFLTPPEQFIYDHLPSDPKWQLLSEPVDKARFERMVYLRPGFFRNGLKVVSHPEIEIESDGDLTVTFAGPEQALMRARVGDDSKFGDDVAPTFVQREGDRLKLNVAFANPGSYILRLYAKPKGYDGAYEWAGDYRVKVKEVKGFQVFYPEVTATFNETNATLLGPMSGRLKSGATESFKLIVPGAEAVSVVVGGEWVPLVKNGETWEGRATVAGDKVQIAARFPGSQSFYVLVTYGVG